MGIILIAIALPFVIFLLMGISAIFKSAGRSIKIATGEPWEWDNNGEIKIPLSEIYQEKKRDERQRQRKIEYNKNHPAPISKHELERQKIRECCPGRAEDNTCDGCCLKILYYDDDNVSYDHGNCEWLIKVHEAEQKIAESRKSTWYCKECGYGYEGISLPINYKCPVCKSGYKNLELKKQAKVIKTVDIFHCINYEVKYFFYTKDGDKIITGTIENPYNPETKKYVPCKPTAKLSKDNFEARKPAAKKAAAKKPNNKLKGDPT